MPTEPESLVLQTEDGRRLAASHFVATGRAVVLVVPAIGVPQRYYRHFAAALCDDGWDVLTFDYRGVGQSADRPIRAEDASLVAWGRHDVPAAFARARQIAPRVVVVGHSIGGSLTGFLPDPSALIGLYSVASQNAHTASFDGLDRLAASLFFRAVLPGVAGVLGWFPGKAIGASDLPRGVALDWARWGRHPLFTTSEAGVAERLAALRIPVVAVGLSDDGRFAPPRAVDGFAAWFRSAAVERRTFTPAEAGGPIGHFGFFRAQMAETLWPHARRTIADFVAASGGLDPVTSPPA